VNRWIAKVVWRALAEHGFRDHTPRSAWRRRQYLVDVVNFQAAVVSGEPLSLGRGVGDASLGTFAVNLGVYFDYRRLLPFPRSPFADARDSERPEEWRCDFRTRLTRIGHGEGSAYPAEMWPVQDDGADAEAAVRDALRSIEIHGLSWLAQQGDLEGVHDHYGRICRGSLARPFQDQFFRCEDVYVAAAIALGRLEDGIGLYESIVARAVDPEDRARHARDEKRRARRKPHPRAGPYVPLPFWHEEACARLEVLRGLRAQ
jgi:hypothetical protein